MKTYDFVSPHNEVHMFISAKTIEIEEMVDGRVSFRMGNPTKADCLAGRSQIFLPQTHFVVDTL